MLLLVTFLYLCTTPVRQYCCVLQLVCSSVQTKLARPNYMLDVSPSGVP